MAVNIFLSVLAGILSALSFDFPHLSFLIWFSLSPLFYILYKRKNSKRYFFIAAFLHYAVAIFWLGFVTRLGAFLLIVYLASYWVAFAYFARVFPKKYAVIAFPALWAALEFVRESIPALGFGWAILGYSQFKNVFIIQIADVLGVKFISLVIVTVNVIIADCWYKKRVLTKELFYGLALIMACFGYSVYALNEYKPKDNVRISVVQPNIPQALKWDVEAKSFIIDRLTRMGRETDSKSLVVYPEASWPGVLNMEKKNGIIEWAKSLRRDVLIGVVTKEGNKFYNTALLLGNNGSIKGEYRKIKLVPFGEYVPLRKFLWFISVFNTMGDISKGRQEHIFEYRHKKFGVLICFEDSFPALVSDFARKCSFLINITNDAWFKGRPQSIQHLSLMAFRAVENRISIVRSANTGISGYVDFLGRIHPFRKSGREIFVEGVDTYSMPLNDRRTIYNKAGRFMDVLLSLAVFFWLSYYWLKKSSVR